MIAGKLFIEGLEIELLDSYMHYYRHTVAHYWGWPTSDIKGGLITIRFRSEEEDFFWHNLTKKIDRQTDRMLKGEIHFYGNGDKDLPLRKYKFTDAYVVNYSQTYDDSQEESIITVLTLSPAIQNYGLSQDFVQHWNISWRPSAEPVYYVPEEEEKEDLVIYINGYFYTTGGMYLGKIGDGDNVYITDQITFAEAQKGKNVEDKVVNFTKKYGLNNEQLLNRAHWVFGEGRGEFADDYAHTIENMKKWGYHGKGFSEEGIYCAMSDDRYKGKSVFFSGKIGYSTYDDFSKARIDLKDLNKLKKADVVIKAVIDQQMGITKDQTPNAIRWLGYTNRLLKKGVKSGKKKTPADNCYDRSVKKYGVNKVLRRDDLASGRSHIFFDSRSQADIDKLKKKKN